MIDDLEQEQINIPESSENIESDIEDIESPENSIETPKQLGQLVEETTEKIQQSADDFEIEGDNQINTAVENYEVIPEEVEDIKGNIREINNKVGELTDSTIKKVKNVSIEKTEEPTQDDIDKEKLREFTKEDKEEEREELAKNIKEERQDFFKKKKDNESKIEEIRLDIENKTKNLDILKNELQSTKDSINEKSTSIFNRFFERSQIKELEKISEETEPKIQDLEVKLQNLLSLEEELASHLEQKLDIDKLQQEVESFYNANINDFKTNQEQKRVVELERLEKEEEGRKVENITEEQGVTFVHAIRDDYVPTLNSMLQKGVGFETKLKMLISLDPTISTSTIKEGDDYRSMWGHMGVILSDGKIEDASRSDAATKAQGISDRLSGGKNSLEDIDKSINDKGDWYNELVVSAPQIAGMFLSSDRSDIDIPDKEFFRIAEELNMPTYFVDEGEIFEVSWGEEGPDFDPEFPPLIVGEKVDANKIKKGSKIFTEEEKKEMFAETIEKDIPFQVESMLPEARATESRNNGVEEYIKLQGNKLSETKIGEEFNVDDLGIDLEDKDISGNRILVGNKVRLLQEIIHMDGSIERYVENNSKVYKQISFSKEKISSTLTLIDYPYKYKNNSIKISYNTHGLDRKLNAPEDYLKSMKKEVKKYKEKIATFHPQNEDEKNYLRRYKDISNRLAFHLNGFAEAAKKFRDANTANTAKKLAQELLSSKDYEEIIKRRIDKNGKFKITKKDLE